MSKVALYSTRAMYLHLLHPMAAKLITEQSRKHGRVSSFIVDIVIVGCMVKACLLMPALSSLLTSVNSVKFGEFGEKVKVKNGALL